MTVILQTPHELIELLLNLIELVLSRWHTTADLIALVEHLFARVDDWVGLIHEPRLGSHHGITTLDLDENDADATGGRGDCGHGGNDVYESGM